MDNNFESKLPNDYVAVKHVNAKSDKKTVFIYTLLSLVPPVIILPVLIFAAKHFSGYEISENLFSYNGTAALIITCAVLLIYIVLHEVLHGITYKIFTGNKLVFGLTLTVAFCGVPDIYVRKKASLYSLLMPFVVFSIFFSISAVLLWLVSPLYGIMAGTVLAIHLGSCVGDLHWVLLYLTEFKDCNTLMRDIGPEQWLFVSKTEAEKYGLTTIDAVETESV